MFDLEISEAKKDGEGVLLLLKKPTKVSADFRLDVVIRGETKMLGLHFWLNTAFLDASGYMLKFMGSIISLHTLIFM